MRHILFILSILTLQFLEASAQELTRESHKISGVWVVDSMDYSPIKIPSYCGSITKGAKLVFESNNRLLVYPKDSNNACNTYGYKVYSDNEISIIEHDMIMSVKYRYNNDGGVSLWSYSFGWDDGDLS